jgi:hypothetical protein
MKKPRPTPPDPRKTPSSTDASQELAPALRRSVWCRQRGIEEAIMGQAKQRGTAEQREHEAREKRREGLHPIDIEELREAHNVPIDAQFIGFVVWLRERDEFLVHLVEEPSMVKRAYGAVVEAAVRFSTWDDAAKHAEASKHPAIVAAAFDMGKQIAIIGE